PLMVGVRRRPKRHRLMTRPTIARERRALMRHRGRRRARRILRMTIDARDRRAREGALALLDVTLLARNRRMPPGQREIRFPMSVDGERRSLEAVLRMTRSTLQPELARMR